MILDILGDAVQVQERLSEMKKKKSRHDSNILANTATVTEL